MRFFITGGAGFIGSAVIRFLINETNHHVLNLDKLTYAGNLQSLASVSKNKRYKFIQGDICDHILVNKLFSEFQPNVVMHLAAESHVDRSIDAPSEFIHSNILGTSVMLEAAREYWKQLPSFERIVGSRDSLAMRVSVTKESFRFHHISTDEVYGSLERAGLFDEKTNYDPSSPYSASKASSDHLVRAWHRTYGLPILITNCSNNYGAYQFPEKLIPLTILNAIDQKPLPIYGNGKHIRDWLHVEDHARALYKVATKGRVGETYNIGGHNEKTNLEVVNAICNILDELVPQSTLSQNQKVGNHFDYYRNLITFVSDRPGHDQRYAIDASKIQKEIAWTPKETFETGLWKTVEWYLKNLDWCKHVQDGSYQRQRIGIKEKKQGAKI